MGTRRNRDPRRFTAEISEHSPFHIVVLDPDLRILWVNAMLVDDFCGVSGELWVGRRLGEMLPGLEVERVEPMLRRILGTGERVTDVECRGPFTRDSRTNRVWGCSGFRVEEPDGEIIGVALVAYDVTERSQDRERLALLNEASATIGSTLDVARTAEETLDVLVPGIGDIAIVNLLSSVLDGGLEPRFEQRAGTVSMEIAAVRWFPGQPVPRSTRREPSRISRPRARTISGSPQGVRSSNRTCPTRLPSMRRCSTAPDSSCAGSSRHNGAGCTRA